MNSLSRKTILAYAGVILTVLVAAGLLIFYGLGAILSDGIEKSGEKERSSFEETQELGR